MAANNSRRFYVDVEVGESGHVWRDGDICGNLSFVEPGQYVILSCREGERLYECENPECGALHPRQRAPKSGQTNYCPECRRKRVPARDHMRRERATA